MSQSTTSASKCKVEGPGLSAATVRQSATFTVTACTSSGDQQQKGGDIFFIAIRGASRVRAKVTDNGDGTYDVVYKPSVSGNYSLAISLFGDPVSGSPFQVTAYPPKPDAGKCELRGECLTNAIARVSHTFEVRFRDALGQIAHAEDLDVYVEPLSATVSRPLPKEVSNGEDEYGDEMALAPASSEQSSIARSYMKSRVEVGSKPLVLRSGLDLDSELLGQLPPGVMMIVLEEQRTEAGDMRARVAPIDEAEARLKVFESWHHPFLETDDEGLATPASPSAEAADTSAGWVPPSRTPPPRTPVGQSRMPMQQIEEEPTSSTYGHAEPLSSPELPVRASSSASGLLDPPLSPISSYTRRSLVSQRRPTQRHRGGWVTIVKSGEELVKRRDRLDAAQRQQHLQQWARRQRTDKSVAAQQAAKIDARFVRSKNNPFEQELVSDPSGIAFAFGGVEPGIIHAHGQLHEVHRAYFSVGRVGTYLLHISLRSQAVPLPGSPFSLQVVPGVAHAHSTKMPALATKLTGLVGDGTDDGCQLRVVASDKMGNLCIAGGAAVACTCTSSDVQCNTVDNDDGSYTLEWRSRHSGVFEVHVLIDKQNIMGSPTTIRLASTVPDLTKTVVSGPGIEPTIEAGMPMNVVFHFRDEYSNQAIPTADASYQFGMSLLLERSGEKWTTAKTHPSTGSWSSSESGEYTLTYVATAAGNSELFLWCADSKEKGEKRLLPGSPFKVLVEPGKASADVSDIDGFVTETADKVAKTGSRGTVLGQGPEAAAVPGSVVAGESVTLRPSIRDSYGNPAYVADGALSVHLTTPGQEVEDSNQTPLQTQPSIRAGVTVYECRHETRKSGDFLLHVLLHGQQIKGSPVKLNVTPAAHDRDRTVIEPPVQGNQLYVDETYTSCVRLRDRFDNYLTTGGATIATRMAYVKQNMHDNNMLTSSNHTATVDDMGDGTYIMKFAMYIKGLSNFPLQANLILNLDKEGKDHPNGIDVNTSLYHFSLTEEHMTTGKGQQGNRRQSTNAGMNRSATVKGDALVAPPPIKRAQTTTIAAVPA